MNNQQIVNIVYTTGIVRRNIAKMVKGVCDKDTLRDLEGIVYCKLLEIDEDRLNYLYWISTGYTITSSKNQLGKFISGIIRNQRNRLKYSEFGKCVKRNYIYNRGIDDEHDFDKDLKIEFIWMELDKWKGRFGITGLTGDEYMEMQGYEVIKFMMERKYTFKELVQHFGYSKSKMAYLLKFARTKIKERYDNYINHIIYDDIV